MPKYIVISPLDHNNRKYEVGETVELTVQEAELMPEAVKPVKVSSSDRPQNSGVAGQS